MSHEAHYDADFFSPNNYEDLRKEWARTGACALGCDNLHIKRTSMSSGKWSEKKYASFLKKNEGKERDVGSYEANFYDMGVDHWEVWQRKTKIIDHKRMEVQVRKSFKNKPSTVPSGGVLKEIHRFKVDYDFRCYDPYEHSGESREEFIRNEAAHLARRYNLLPIVRQSIKKRTVSPAAKAQQKEKAVERADRAKSSPVERDRPKVDRKKQTAAYQRDLF